MSHPAPVFRALRPLPALIALTLALALALMPAAVRADTIYLRNNRTVIGIIDSVSSDDRQVTIRTSSGTMKVPRANIVRIEKQENLSYTEASGDLALSESNLDRALDLYQKALLNEPENAILKKKVQDVREQIQERDQRIYGAQFENIEKAIKGEEFARAIELATSLVDRVKEPSAKEHCRELIAAAHIGIARDFRDRVDYPEAEKHYSLAMQAFPDGALAPLELADMLQLSPARKTAAIPLYRKGIDLAGAHPETMDEELLLDYRFKMGQLYFGEKQFPDAADAFLTVTRADIKFRYPQAVDLAVEAYAKIQAGSQQRDMAHIVENLRSIIALKPNDDRAYLLLGRIYYDQQDWTNARDMLRAAVDNAPKGAGGRAQQEALYYLGISYRKLGQIEEAADAFKALTTQDPNNYDALCELGEIRQDQANYTGALDLFEKALGVDRDKYRAYLGKGQALRKLGRHNEARDNFREVVERDPGNARAQFAIAQSFFESEKWDDVTREAQKTIDLIAQLPADSPQPLAERNDIVAQSFVLMGNASLTQKKTNLAREQFEKALAVMPAFAAAFDGIGKTYQADGRHKDAEEHFQKAIAADPANPNYYLSLGINWHNYRKNTAEALKYYYKYMELGGKDPNVRTWIGECGGVPPEPKTPQPAPAAAQPS